jgi:predicted dehydrogenase
MDQKIKVGIIGYGYMGQIRAKNINDNPDMELAGICDPYREADIAKLNIPVYQKWEDLIASELDSVIVCTPNFAIPNIAVHAMNKGKHVFCEKPPGRNYEDIKRICNAESNNPGVKLIFGFNHRHHPGITDAKAIIDSGSLGQIISLRGVYGKGGGYDYHTSWRNDVAVSGGGILLDQGIHMLDLFRYFVGDFVEIKGMRGITLFDVDVEDNAVVILRTAKGQLAQLHSSATSWKHTFRLEIGCEKGYVVISGLLSKTGSYGRETLIIGRRPTPDEKMAVGNPREETVYYDHDPSWDIEIAHFAECITNKLPITKGTSTDALKVMEIIDEVYQLPIIHMDKNTVKK